MALQPGTITMEGATLLFRNFSGREGPYNQEGVRNFCVILQNDEEPYFHKTLEADGWNVKYLRPREEGDQPTPYLKVGLKYHGRKGTVVRPPTTVMIGSKGRTTLDEDTVEVLDQIDIEYADLIIRPYSWDVNGRTGVTAYLQTLFVTVREDYLQLKYSDVPEIGGRLAIGAGSGEEIWDAEVVDEDDDTQLAISTGR